VCAEKRSEDAASHPAIQPSSPPSERREKKEKATILQSTHGRCCRYRSESNQIPQIPNLITTSSNWKRISDEREERERGIYRRNAMLPSEKHSGSAGVRINILFQFSILNKKGMNNNSLVNSLLRKPHQKIRKNSV
jgi:hypothetical protein